MRNGPHSLSSKATQSLQPAAGALLPPRVFFVVGPTGAGKSQLAAELAAQIDAEIIGLDAFQIYTGLAVLTAQPGEDLQRLAPHHLIGVIDPAQAFSAGDYARRASAIAWEVHRRGHLPLFTGGTGMYVHALMGGLNALPAPDPELRRRLSSTPKEQLIEELQTLDPAAVESVDAANPRRLQRAIEIIRTTGLPLAKARHLQTPPPTPPGILLLRDRDTLVRRIETSVRTMPQRGVFDEIARCAEASETARKAIGFQDGRAVLAGKMTAATWVERTSIATRQFARRQLTWFRGRHTFPTLNLSQDRSQNLHQLRLKAGSL